MAIGVQRRACNGGEKGRSTSQSKAHARGKPVKEQQPDGMSHGGGGGGLTRDLSRGGGAGVG